MAGMLRVFSILCLSAAVILPVGLFPFEDFLRNYLALSFAIFFSSSVLIGKTVSYHYSPTMVFIICLSLVWTAGYFVSGAENGIKTSYFNYLITFFVLILYINSVKKIEKYFGKDRVVLYFAIFIVLTGLAASLIGLVRYYGILKVMIPIVVEDGNRLIGTFGQPNLMALYVSLSVISLIYLRREKFLAHSFVFYGSLCVLFYVGFLTSSKSWYIFSILILCYLASDYFSQTKSKQFIDARYKAVVALWLVFLVLSPKLDAIISDPLIESGFLNRLNAEEVFEARKTKSVSARAEEWRKIFLYNDQVQNFWFGNGLGRYSTFSNDVDAVLDSNVRNGKVWINSHNIFIMALVEWGVIGFCVFIFFIGYLFSLLCRAFKSRQDLFCIWLALIIFSHNIVEFSLWYLIFTLLFFTAVGLVEKSKEKSFSVSFIPNFIGLSVLIVYFFVSIYVLRDAGKVINVMYSTEVDNKDYYALEDISNNSLVGSGADKVRVLKFLPKPIQIHRQLRHFSMLVEWRPEPLFLLRKATLTAAVGQRSAACSIITRSIELYPDTFNKIHRELSFFESQGMLEKSDYEKCILEGIDDWLSSDSFDINADSNRKQ